MLMMDVMAGKVAGKNSDCLLRRVGSTHKRNVNVWNPRR